MKDVYVSWVKGLPQDKEALSILRDSGVVSGIEMSNIDNQIELVKDSGLKVSSHTPGMDLTLNLAALDYMAAFEGEQGDRLLRVIRDSDASTVGFHCGYAAEEVYKMTAFPNVPKSETLFTDRQSLLERITNNVILLENRINNGLPENNQKKIVLETMDYSREKPVPWESQQNKEAVERREDIAKMVRDHGINAGILYVTDPSFIRRVLVGAADRNVKPIGLLFDVGHNLISADAKIHKRMFRGTVEDYFDSMLLVGEGRTYQLHLTVPEGNADEGYVDHHHTFRPGENLSDYVMQLAKGVVQKSPEISVVTLEMRTGLEPVEHAKEMVRQAEYVSKELF